MLDPSDPLYSTKKVIILGGSELQRPYISEFAKLGYEIYLVDGDKACAGSGLVHRHYVSPYDDLSTLKKIGVEIGLAPTDVIFSAAAQFALIGASFLASNFGIEFPDQKTIHCCLDKSRFYDWFVRNEIPIPETKIINNKLELIEFFKQKMIDRKYFIKSDYSKNPHYVYKVKNRSDLENVNWIRDRYFRNYYIIQEEFIGHNLRINIFPSGYNVFDFFSDRFIDKIQHKYIFKAFPVIEKLRLLVEMNGLSNWIVKFDVIIGPQGWVALDIGLDPPTRMRKWVASKGINFHELYVQQYLGNDVAFPSV